MNDQPHIQLQIRSNPLFLSGVRELVYHVSHRAGFSETCCHQMSLAVDEAICNVIRHGYDRAADRPIWISLFFDGGLAEPDLSGAGGNGSAGSLAVSGAAGPTKALRIVIEDEARQVDPSTIRSRDLDDIRPGGLGVHIIHEVMDEVRYEHRDSRGMRLTMVKKRRPPEARGKEDAHG